MFHDPVPSEAVCGRWKCCVLPIVEAQTYDSDSEEQLGCKYAASAPNNLRGGLDDQGLTSRSPASSHLFARFEAHGLSQLSLKGP